MDEEATLRRTSVQRTIARLRLGIVRGADAGRELEVRADVPAAVGSSADNDLVLRDPLVSRYHLELSPGSHGVAVRDLGSSNGTWIGGMRIESVVVPPGTELQLGDTLLAIRAGVRDVSSDVAPPSIPGLVFSSESMREVARTVAKLCRSELPVLVRGETGTGKELIASAIHALGPRRNGPFEVVDCGSLPPALVASELFGHERGAFTSADRRYHGAFERAHGGTLFLDEIGELPMAVQPNLLGVLERSRFRRVGGDRDIESDVRVICATNRDLRAEVNGGSFRADLYFRLAVGRILLPPLRERPEDIEPLVRHFTEQYDGPGSTMPFDEVALDAMRGHFWGGNVRELRNVVEASLTMGELTLDAVQPVSSPLSAPPPLVSRQGWLDGSGQRTAYRDARAAALREFERSYLGELISECDGNASEAARRAKMDRPYLLTLLKRHGLR